ncbi:MAG: hypothetical protein LBT36_01015 [Oscillospiraceae bacterium]|jgi:hypothetical protein|nr:hypothetical protein [Oscillospiraceae bacterium]
MDKLCKVIRAVSVPPLAALVMVSALYIFAPGSLGALPQAIALVVFLTVLPVLAYPLQPLIPGFKGTGRAGQRKLAFIACVVGYACGIAFALLTRAPRTVHIIYWTYFLSVALLTVFNAATKWKASGHACGVAGPLIAMIYFLGARTLPLILAYFAVFWASVRIKRHTPLEFILGGLDSIAAFALVLLVSKLLF